MLPITGARSPFFALAACAGFVIVFIFGVLAWRSPSKIPFHHGNNAHSNLGVNEALQILFAPTKLEPTAKSVRSGEDVFELPENPRYTKPMGNDILILDLDTRPLESTEEYKKGKFEWRDLNHVSAGVFNHYTYALIHGYDYKFIKASNFEDRHATWIKPSALANQIKNYKFIVFLDADATFRFLHLPIEWMLNYWDIKPKDAITMAKDPWDPASPQYNSDRFNRTYTNTGFMIVQNNKKIQEILKAWHECPDDTRYKECSQWKTPKFHEQSAFGEYIRYDYEDDIKELDCKEANGFPGVEISNCTGHFVRHYWFDKSLVKMDYRDNIMQALTLPIQKAFADNTNGIVVETGKNQIY
ncbi:hypothetical protein BU24DRAFT_414763 [Aaosphaeria arxii CBS 175.79]|uniref:Nucleotide-diphospho-sugar transferase domain-containing protein n=1 Tax=Aaosphaeria arxii CBS 175.79 TaxID=1450172 RepID=A0A6A5X901_9PLEO|nr:uncharacterized protein BU24DRAFT_414763 [Aaosphaeria arxii CBS 175.79]KAF2009432.1 hypothetical protein BU24DRAFT_414763 [Aaosphaeria arxii CBS 175.79]